LEHFLETIADFEVQYSQFLDPNGKPSSDIPGLAKDTDALISLYRAMTETRVFDTKAINLQRTGKLGTYASSLGHEATHVGLAAAMLEDDVLAPSYRETGTLLYRGVRPEELLLYWGGDERGSDFADAKNDFPYCVPIATQCLHAAGAAMAFQLRGETRCAVSLNGDGGTSEGAFYEAMNIAGARNLPVIFIVINNKWAISVPIEQQTATQTLAQKSVAAGIPGIQVDGNDVIAVQHWVERALTRARNGEGACLIETVTYRLSDHTTADDASRYRKKEDVEAAWTVEPLIRLRKYLTDLGVWDENKEEALLEDAADKVDVAVQKYLNTPQPPVESMFDYMYEQLPEFLEEQRAHAIRYADKNGGNHG
jgi:pyruvate dehydrogenase E1 component alpha subunit